MLAGANGDGNGSSHGTADNGSRNTSNGQKTQCMNMCTSADAREARRPRQGSYLRAGRGRHLPGAEAPQLLELS